MKTFRSIAAVFVFAAVLVLSGFAQTGAAQTAAPAKIVVIDTGAFGGTDDKGTGGITKYVNAQDALEKEFGSVQADLKTIATRIQTLEADIQKLQAAPTPKAVPVGGGGPQAVLQAKADEYQALQIEFKRKQEDAKVKFERRQGVIMGPVMQDIYKSLQDFTTQKGYDLILDAAKLDAGQMIIGFNPAKIDVTKEFITFYNARPGTTASAAAPK